jgi:hypothetical protein
LPEVPVNVTVELVATAVGAADSVMLCAVPGVRVSVDGVAVTPVGRPVVAMATAPVKEFIGFAVILIGDPVRPAVMDTEVGDRVSVKSGGGEMAAVTVEVCESIPDVAVIVSIALPAVAAADAVRVTACGVPGVRVSMDGCAVTPLGSPVIATDTMLAKPFTGTALMLICCPGPPGRRVTVVGVADKEKSATGAGLEPPPQEVSRRAMRVEYAQSAFEEERISTIRLYLVENETHSPFGRATSC